MILRHLNFDDVVVLHRAVTVYIKNWKGRNHLEYRAAVQMRRELAQLVRVHKKFGHGHYNVDPDECIKVLITALSLYECSKISHNKLSQTKGVRHKLSLTLQERSHKPQDISYITIRNVAHKMPKKGSKNKLLGVNSGQKSRRVENLPKV